MATEKKPDPMADVRAKHGRVANWADKYTFDKLPAEHILKTSSDKRTVVTKDGTRLSAENMKAAAADITAARPESPKGKQKQEGARTEEK